QGLQHVTHATWNAATEVVAADSRRALQQQRVRPDGVPDVGEVTDRVERACFDDRLHAASLDEGNLSAEARNRKTGILAGANQVEGPNDDHVQTFSCIDASDCF